MRKIIKELIPITIISILTVLVYLSSFSVPFILDDYHVVQINPNIKNISEINPLSSRSILTYSLAINYYLGGLNPFGYHLMNLVLHVINSILVYYLAFSLFSQLKKDKELENTITSVFCALIFALHPLHVGTVVQISSRSAVLMTTFFLLSLLLFIKAKENKKLLLLSLLTFIFAILSKEDAIVLPLIIILYDLCFNIEKFSFILFLKRFVKYYMPYFVVLITGIFILKINIMRMISNLFTSQLFGNGYEHFLTGLKSILYYIKLIYIPFGWSTEYFIKPAQSFFELYVILSFIFIIMILLSGIILYRKHGWATFCIYWFFITLIPTTTFVVMRDLVTDRWAYLPSVGFLILVPCFFLCSEISFRQIKILPLQKKIAIYLAIIIIFMFMILAAYRIYIYTNEQKLWENTLEKNPYSFYALSSLGSTYMKKGQFENAEEQFIKVIQLFNDSSAEARINMGIIYHKQGKTEQAISHLSRAIEMQSAPLIHAQAYVYLARIYDDLNQTQLKDQNLQKAQELVPEYYEGIFNQFFNIN